MFAAPDQSVVLFVADAQSDVRLAKAYSLLNSLSAASLLQVLHVADEDLTQHSLIQLLPQLTGSATNDGVKLLIVIGGDIEERVTACVLTALGLGYDVCFLTDSFKLSEGQNRVCLQSRLMQAGAFPSTLRQLLYLWAFQATDTSQVACLKQLLRALDE